MDANDISTLERALGITFRRRELLRQALTHSSHAHEAAADEAIRDNELLEFLGDAVLGMVTSEALFQRFPARLEGELSKLRAHLVSSRHLAQVANAMRLGEYLRLGRGEEKSGGRAKSALLVDALEAVLAAIYLDSGFDAARNFILQRIVTPGLEQVAATKDGTFNLSDYKSALQEAVQSLGGQPPAYRVAREAGPEHKKTFTVELQVFLQAGAQRPDCVAHGEGSSKKIAEQRAARQALECLEARSARSPA